MVGAVKHPREGLSVEVLTPLLAVWGSGRVREWSEARADQYRLWLLLDQVSARFRGQITIYIVEPLSLQGIARVLRHRIGRFPTFLIGGQEKYTGWDHEEVSRLIARRLAEDETD